MKFRLFLLWPKLIMSSITTQCVSFTKQWDQYADFWFRICCSMFADAAKLTKMVNLTKLVRIEMWLWILCWGIHDKDVLSVSDTGGLPPNGRCLCDLLVTSHLILNNKRDSRNTRYSSINAVCPKYRRETEGGRSFGNKTVE